MCGRFTLTTDDYAAVADALDAFFDPEDALLYRPRFNVAPTDPHWIICTGQGARRIVPGVWGMFPPWNDRRRPHGFINARSESAFEKNAFREAATSTRCLAVADGFYEWTGAKGDRRPLWFHRPDRAPFGLAGLWRPHTDPETGEVERRFCVLTTDANETVAPFHDRMPVILGPGRFDAWLDPEGDGAGTATAEGVAHLLGPAPDDLLVATPVSKRVNRTEHDDPACIEEVRPPEQESLF